MEKPIALVPPLESTDAREYLINRLAAMPLSTEDLLSTWCPADWEDIVSWYDEFITSARELSPNRYRS